MKTLLIAAFLALNVADVYLTNRVLAGGGWEANPLMTFSQAHLGAWWWASKMILITTAVFFMSRWTVKWIAPWVAFMAIIVVNNAIWS